MPDPFTVAVPGVEPHLAAGVLAGAADPELDRDAAALRKFHRRVDAQVDGGVAELVGGAQDHVEDGAGRQGHHAVDDVVDEPRLQAGVEAAGQDQLTGAGDRGGRAEQRVPGPVETESGRVTGPGNEFRPVRLVLERVGGQRDPVPTGEPGVQVDRHTGGPEATGGDGQGGLLVTVAAQRGDAVDQAGQHRVRAGFQDRVDAHRGDGVGEPDGLADVPHPVPRVGEQVGLDPPGDGGDQRDNRGVEGDPGDGLGERGEHRVHQRRVERVAHGETLGPLEPGGDRFDLLGGAGDDHRVRAVDRGDVNTGRDLVGGGLHRDHRAAGGQRLHQPGAGGDQGARVVQGEHPGHVRGRDLTDRVPGEHGRTYAPRLQQPVEGDLDGEDGRLGVAGGVQVVPVDRQPGTALVERVPEHREPGGQLPSHTGALRTLPGEDQAEGTGSRLPVDHGVADQRGPVRHRTAPGQGETHVDLVTVDGTYRRDLLVQGCLAARRDR
ncbi:hypothetical protein Aco03nite_052430 [Actinoplanes couchii]|uniref:Uncharacterized protein n=1 Tax=Actinoplanes couchii TaxID=403638 RepID=A0ABQ3XEB7_9ACTN|nr:hypothetical protein Aco03nite_052430 [Actinoplanes couchii]